jgi:Bifunctional DNA primase/polymerase, N-terminal
MTADALAGALDLAARGYAVFPCRGNKHPATQNGFRDAANDPAALRKLWRRYPGPLVGVATRAPSRIAVLDIDAKHPGSHFWWKANRARLMPTRVHRTRSRGLHLVYLHCEGLKCSAGKIAPGVDVRGEGGYAVWWPADGLPVLSDAPIASWPEWLSEILAPPLRPPPMLHRSARIVSPSFIETRIEAVLRFVFDAPIRERNSRLYWAACRVIEMIRGDDLDCVTGDQALDELRQIVAPVGLSDREVVLTITSATRGRGT